LSRAIRGPRSVRRLGAEAPPYIYPPRGAFYLAWSNVGHKFALIVVGATLAVSPYLALLGKPVPCRKRCRERVPTGVSEVTVPSRHLSLDSRRSGRLGPKWPYRSPEAA